LGLFIAWLSSFKKISRKIPPRINANPATVKSNPMEMYFAEFVFFKERKIKILRPPINIGDVEIEKSSIPRDPNIGLANEAHIRIAAYKKPHGKSAVTIPSEAAWERGEYLIMLLTAPFKNFPFPFFCLLTKKIICINATIAIKIEIFFAEKFKKSLKRSSPNIPEINPIIVYEKDLLTKYCHVFF
jgi:hypothetical protein